MLLRRNRARLCVSLCIVLLLSLAFLIVARAYWVSRLDSTWKVKLSWPVALEITGLSNEQESLEGEEAVLDGARDEPGGAAPEIEEPQFAYDATDTTETDAP